MSGNEAFIPTSIRFDFSKYEDPYEVTRVDLVRALIPDGNGGQAIDVGSGPGFFSKLLAEKQWNVTAIDTARTNLDQAAAYARTTRLGDAVTVLKGVPSGQYELAIALELIEHMPRHIGVELIGEIVRVLRPGGTLLLSTPNRHSPEGLYGFYYGEKIKRAGKWLAWESTHVYIYSASEIIRIAEGQGLSVSTVAGYWYRGKLPVIGFWGSPRLVSSRFPLNRFGFNVVLSCRKR
jgi:2-polyprenyl-3-methyl-5-hydroxy-6-metoxy-1,4-benzoquinol methylase